MPAPESLQAPSRISGVLRAPDSASVTFVGVDGFLLRWVQGEGLAVGRAAVVLRTHSPQDTTLHPATGKPLVQVQTDVVPLVSATATESLAQFGAIALQLSNTVALCMDVVHDAISECP